MRGISCRKRENSKAADAQRIAWTMSLNDRTEVHLIFDGFHIQTNDIKCVLGSGYG